MSVSKVVQSQDPPLTWQDDWDDEHASVKELEDWLASLTETVRTLRLGEIEALRELAASGDLVLGETEKFEPVASFPHLFELKWRFRRAGKKPLHVRQYHIEPDEHPAWLVAVHRHIKGTHGGKTAVQERQNVEISQAQLRAVGRRSAAWGIDTT
jgi:hypothetical protein